MIHRLSQVMKSDVQVQLPDGSYAPARPCQDTFRFERLKAAWAVLTKRADAFIWPEQEPGNALRTNQRKTP